jgi:hypothetical protein
VISTVSASTIADALLAIAGIGLLSLTLSALALRHRLRSGG